MARKKVLARWRLVSPSGAEVISLRQLPPTQRLRYVAPSLFTVGNMFCGISAVFVSFSGTYWLAALLVGIAILLDIADGLVARMVGATSPIGVQLDSLADLVSFGIAPAALIFNWGLGSWPLGAWLAAFFWLYCASFRLARFNVTVDPTADKRYFVGLASPAAAGVVIASAYAYPDSNIGPQIIGVPIFPVVIAVVPALLMVMTIRFRSFRNLIHPEGKYGVAITAVSVLAIAVGLLFFTKITSLFLAYGYVLQAPFGVLTAPLREKLLGPEAIAPPRIRMRSVFLSEDDGLEDDVQIEEN